MTTEEYFSLYPEAALPHHHGEPAGRGHIKIGKEREEGFALLHCGETSVQIPYTLLHHVHLHIGKNSPYYAELCALQKAIYSITCEASLGHTGVVGDDL